MALEATHRAKQLAALNALEGRRAGRPWLGGRSLALRANCIGPARNDHRTCSTIGRRDIRVRTISRRNLRVRTVEPCRIRSRDIMCLAQALGPHSIGAGLRRSEAGSQVGRRLLDKLRDQPMLQDTAARTPPRRPVRPLGPGAPEAGNDAPRA